MAQRQKGGFGEFSRFSSTRKNFANRILFHFSYREIKKAGSSQNLRLFPESPKVPLTRVREDCDEGEDCPGQLFFPFIFLPLPETPGAMPQRAPKLPQANLNRGSFQYCILRYRMGILSWWDFSLEEPWALFQGTVACLCPVTAHHIEHLVTTVRQSYEEGLTVYHLYSTAPQNDRQLPRHNVYSQVGPDSLAH